MRELLDLVDYLNAMQFITLCRVSLENNMDFTSALFDWILMLMLHNSVRYYVKSCLLVEKGFILYTISINFCLIMKEMKSTDSMDTS